MSSETHAHSDHDHNPSGDHNHDHAGHGHAPANFGMAFAVGIALNLGFVVVEAAYGLISNSMALIADAGHNLSDVFGLVVAWIAAVLVRRKATPQFTYGLRSSSILAAFLNAVFLLIAVGAIAVEAIRRFYEPSPVAGGTVMIVAAIGIVINGATALMFMRGRKGDINIRGAFLHMASDAAVSAGVVAAGFVIAATGWRWVDPVVSLGIVAVIVAGTWGLLRDSVRMTLHGVPPGVDADAVRTFLLGQPGVEAIHDLHIWSMSTTEAALTCHLVMPGGFPGDDALAATAHMLEERFNIPHATLQVEMSTACVASCEHAPTSA